MDSTETESSSYIISLQNVSALALVKIWSHGSGALVNKFDLQTFFQKFGTFILLLLGEESNHESGNQTNCHS